MIDRSTMPVLLLLGPPGAGKATQARLLEDRFGLVHMSLRDLLRQDAKMHGETGRAAQVRLETAPDDRIFSVLEDRLQSPDCGAGIVIDGFPTTLEQAHWLEDFLAVRGARVTAALSLDLDDDAVMTRLMGRQRCDRCGEPYHITLRLPSRPGCCDQCGSFQIRRDPDDTHDRARARLTQFRRGAPYVSDFYNSLNLLRPMNGAREIDTITQDLRNLVRPLVTTLWGCGASRKNKPNLLEETR